MSEVAQTNAPASTSSTESAPSSAPSSTPAASPVESSSVLAGAPEQQAAPSFDYKFKYRDGSAEKSEGEIDEWARSFVNADNHERFKEIWAKAHGLDFVKNRFSKIRDEYSQYRSTIDPMVQGWNTLTQYYNKGDMDSFFKGLQIPEEKIYKYVLDKLQYNELPPEQRQMRDQQQQLMRREMELEKQNEFLQQQYQQTAVDARTQQLDVAMSKPEVIATAQAFDSKFGRQGAFRDEVIKRGVLAWHTTGQDISPEQAIAEVLQVVGIPANSSTQAAAFNAPPQAMAAAQGMAAPAKTPPVLPNVGAKNTSPAKRGPKSLDEIRKLAAQMNG